MMKKTAFIIALMIVFAGCRYRESQESDRSEDAQHDAELSCSISADDQSGLPDEMPEDFAISYSWWIGGKNTIDTYDGYIEKDLVMNGTETTAYTPDEDELREIYGILANFDISSIEREMTSAVLTTDDTMLNVSPCTYYEISFTADGRTYTIKGDATAWGYRNSDKDAEVFCNFCSEMSSFVRETDEYQSLPEVEGGYA